MDSRMRNEEMDYLFDIILKLETREECYRFFDDLCSIKELKSLAQRLTVAKMLNDGKVYSDIVRSCGASTATISRVKRSLDYGCGSYEMLFGRMEEEK